MRTILAIILFATCSACTQQEIATTGEVSAAAIRAVAGNDKAKIARVAKAIGDIQKASDELSRLAESTKTTLK